MNATESRLDASPYLWQQAVEHLIEKVERADYPELKAEEHIPTVYEGGPGAEFIKQLMIDFVGRAKVTSAPGDDAPLVGLVGVDGLNTAVVRSITAKWRVTFQEYRTAIQAGIDVSSEKAFGAKRMVMAESDRIAYLGDPDAGLYGLFTFPFLPKVISPIAFDDPTVTPDQILQYMSIWSGMVYKITRRVFKSDAVLMPSEVWRVMNTTFRNATSDTTIMDLWRKSNPHINYVDEVSHADEAGFGGTPAIIFYKKDPSHVKRYIPQMIEQLVHHNSDTFKEVLVHERNAGTFFSRLSGIVVEGVLGQ